MAEDDLDPNKILKKARQAMSSAEVRKKFYVLDHWGPNRWYKKQLIHYGLGAKVHQRIVLGAKQSGKSVCCSFETALHATGAYPDWWTGRRFNKPVRIWIAGPSLALVRDGAQKKVLGISAVGEIGTGMIPLSSIVGRPIMIPGGTQNVDTIAIWHETNGVRDGQSIITYKSFEMGPEKLQAESVDVIWVDERTLQRRCLLRTACSNDGDGRYYLFELHAAERRWPAHRQVPPRAESRSRRYYY